MDKEEPKGKNRYRSFLPTSSVSLIPVEDLPEGKIDEKRFAAMMGITSTLAVVSLIAFFSIGMVGAALGVGIGGFVANFDSVNASDGGEVFPVLGVQAACEQAPQVQAKLDGTTEIDGQVEFFKDLPLPSNNFNSTDFARLTIIGQSGTDPIKVTGLNLRLSALKATTLTLDDAEIKEFGPSKYEVSKADYAGAGSWIETTDSYTDGIDSDGPEVFEGQRVMDPSTGNTTTPEFGIDAAGGFNIDNGTAAAHQVSFDGISIKDVNLAVQILNKSETDTGRLVEPNNRTCQSLADESRSDSWDAPGS